MVCNWGRGLVFQTKCWRESEEKMGTQKSGRTVCSKMDLLSGGIISAFLVPSD